MAHIDGTGSQMSLYITSDVAASGTVSIPLQSWSTPFSVTPNNTTVISIPPATAYVGTSDAVENKGIHITSDLPIVLYSHIYSGQRSDATLVLPVPTLGKEYYTISFTQTSQQNSEFLIVAPEDSTEVEITPSQTTLNGHLANVPFTVTLNKGQVYQVQSPVDITGSHVVSRSSGSSACKRIAVFSGSAWDGICTETTGGSSDNLYEQVYPVNTWGSNFVTAPFVDGGGDFFRIFAGTDNTIVVINGTTPLVLNKGQFFDTLLVVSSYITASNPVMLAQFSRTNACTDGKIGDPSMVILNPIEQTLNDIALYCSPYQSISQQYINVVMKTANVGSFRLDGAPVTFTPTPANPVYSFSQTSVNSGNHTLIADSGFNAIAYGYGDLESYAYCAGANAKNLNLQINASSGTTTNPRTVCSGSTVNFSGNVSYNPGYISWNFGNGDTASSLQTSHTYDTPGKYTIYLVTSRSAGGGCDGTDSATYVLTVAAPPTADFSFVIEDTCTDNKVTFSDLSSTSVGIINSWKWYFGDGDSSTVQNPQHHYATTSTFNARLIVKSSNGCTAEITKPVSLFSANGDAGPDTVVCKGNKVQLHATGGVSYSWKPASAFDNSNIANPTAVVSGSTTYTVQIKNQNGCSKEVMVTAGIYNLPVIVLSKDTSICGGEPVTLFASGAGHYIWTSNGGVICNNCNSVNTQVSTFTTYAVTGTDDNGCTGSANVRIFVRSCKIVVMPDAFTPNNDGKNDLLHPLGSGIVEVEYSIYNRWGQLMFTSKDLNHGWDGKYNGTPQPGGVYAWKLSATLDDGGTVDEHGNVTLIR